MAIGNPYGTFENFVKEWDSKLESTIRNFKLNEDTEDVKNQIYLELLEKAYLDRFDSDRATISTWIYGFVKNSLRKKYHSNRRDFIYNGITIMDNYEEDAVGQALFLNIFSTDSHEEDAVLRLAIESIIETLGTEEYAAHSYSSAGVPRDMKTVVELFLEGLSPKEIAEKFETSVQFVYKLIKRMATLPQVQALHI